MFVVIRFQKSILILSKIIENIYKIFDFNEFSVLKAILYTAIIVVYLIE